LPIFANFRRLSKIFGDVRQLLTTFANFCQLKVKNGRFS
jgi:hypothetical protein